VQRLVEQVFVHNAVLDYAVQLVHATRVPAEYGLPHVAARVAYGASPRASLGLVAAGRALALLRGRDYVLPQDVVAIAPEVLRHRVVLSYEALADDLDADSILIRVLRAVPVPDVVLQP
jgi:MoxR-like ATPase